MAATSKQSVPKFGASLIEEAVPSAAKDGSKSKGLLGDIQANTNKNPMGSDGIAEFGGTVEEYLIAPGSLEEAFCCTSTDTPALAMNTLQGDIFMTRLPLRSKLFSGTIAESIEARRKAVEAARVESNAPASTAIAPPMVPPLSPPDEAVLRLNVEQAQALYESDKNYKLSLENFLMADAAAEEADRKLDEEELAADKLANPDAREDELLVDKYGFVIDNDISARNAKAAPKEAASAEKWIGTLAQWDALERKKKIRARIRKGIPNRVRGKVWKKMAKVDELRAENPGLYASLVALPSPFEAQIHRDLNRTFPTHIFFREAGGMGQTSLFNVVKAYSVYDKEVGYCQGMNFIAGLFLLYMPEEDAFLMMIRVCQTYGMGGFFLPGFPLLHKYFHLHEHAMAIALPGLAAHFRKQSIMASMYAFQWYTTVFSADVIPFEHILRVWDLFLIDGLKFTIRASLALLKQHQDELLSLGFEQLVPRLKQMQVVNCSPDDLIKTACELHLSTRKMDKIERDYDASTIDS